MSTASVAKRFDTLDLLRGVAALAVATLHYAAITGSPPVFPHAYLAVDMFFALSGFVIAHAYGRLLAEGGSVSRFMIRRLVRLYPLYLLGTLVGWFLIVGALSPQRWLSGLGANLLFLPAFPANGRLTEGLFPALWPAWSLFWELIANVMFALLAPRLSSRILGIILAFGLIVLIATGAAYGTLDAGARWSTFFGGAGRVLWSYFAGVALYRSHEKSSLPWSPSGGLLAVLLVAALAVPKTGWGYDVVIAALLPLLVLFGAKVDDPSPTGRWLGHASYAVYILHVPLLNIAIRFTPLSDTPQLILLLPCIGATLCAAAFVSRYVDDPVRSWLGRLIFSRKTRPAPALF